MTSNNHDGTVTFQFTIPETDAEYLMDIIRSELSRAQMKVLEKMSNNDCNPNELTFWKSQVKYISDLRNKILVGE